MASRSPSGLMFEGPSDMAQQFLHQRAWPAITAAVKRSPGRCEVAVAYFADGAAALLPLKSGSVLVVDASDASVKAGRTCPSELRKLMNRGVRVHTVANLHAKVFVTPATAFVGSTNASRTSRDLLLEASISFSDKKVIAAARAWVRSLMAVEIGPGELDRLEAIYRPPRFSPLGARTGPRSKRPMPQQQHTTWLVKTASQHLDEDEQAARDKGHPVAHRRLSDRTRFEVDEFAWKDGLDELKRGHIVVVVEKTPAGEYVYPPARVLNVTPCRDRRSKVVFFERPKVLTRRSSRTVKNLLGRRLSRLFNRINASRVGSSWAHELAHAAGAS